MPEGVQVIAESAFDDCKSMEELHLPKTVREIGDFAFHGCDCVKHFCIPATVDKIGTYAFGSCESLEQIEVAENNCHYTAYEGNLYTKDLTVLLQYAIGKRDTSFTLPDLTRVIAFRAISDAFHLESVDLNRVSEVGAKALYYDTGLKTV